jgi:hypothetical protein
MPPKRQEGHPPLLGDRIIYEEYVKQKEDASKTSEALRKEGSTYPTRKQVAKAVKRMLDNTSAEYWVRKQKGAQGRLPVLDAIGIQNLVDEAERAKNENRIIRLNVKQAHDEIMRERLNMIVRLKRETSLDTFDRKKYDVSERKLNEYMGKIWPEQFGSKPVTDSRDKAKSEIRNAISCAAVAGSVFERTNPECILTHDHMACFIDKNHTIKITVAAEGSQAAMRRQGLSIGHQQEADIDAEGNVKLPCHCSMTMSGKFVSCIAEIWDDQILASNDGNRVAIYALDGDDPNDILSATCFSCYIAFGTPHELVMYEMYTKIIIPKGHRIRERARALADQRHDAFGRAPSVLPSVQARPPESPASKVQRIDHSVKIGSVQPGAATSHQTSGAIPGNPSFAVPDLNPVFQQLMDGGAVQFLSPSRSPFRPGTPRTVAKEVEPVAPVGRSTSNSNGGRRRARDVDASSDDEEDEVCFGTWVGQATEFDLVLGLDGDSAPLTAFTDKERMASFKDSKHPFGRACIQDIIATNVWGVVLLLKWAAACSMLQSPNDVGKTHQVLRKGMKGTKKKKTLPVPFKDCNPFLQAEFKRLHATNMPADRKKGFWRLLSNLPGAASEAFRPRIVKSSWHKCGFYPLSIHMILDKCTLWRKKPEDGGLSDEEKKAVLEAIPGLQDIAFRKGRVSDAEMLAVLPFLSRYPTGLVHDLGDLVVNRDRCCLVLHPSFLEARQVAADEARARDPSLKKKPLKKKKPAKNAVVWEEFSQHSHRCTAAEIVEQLEIRDIHPGFAKKKEALLAMFEKYSALPDKRYVNVAAAAAPVVATARAPPVRPALVLGPSSHVGLEQLRAAQSALPATPQRRVAAAGAQFFGGGGPASAISPAVSSPRRSPRSGAVAAARGGGVKKVRVCAVCKNAGHQKNSSKCPMRDSLILQNPQVFQLSD